MFEYDCSSGWADIEKYIHLTSSLRSFPVRESIKQVPKLSALAFTGTQKRVEQESVKRSVRILLFNVMTPAFYLKAVDQTLGLRKAKLYREFVGL